MEIIVITFMFMFIIELIELMLVNPGRIFQGDIAKEVIEYYMKNHKNTAEETH